jgi:hypothetical protein
MLIGSSILSIGRGLVSSDIGLGTENLCLTETGKAVNEKTLDLAGRPWHLSSFSSGPG